MIHPRKLIDKNTLLTLLICLNLALLTGIVLVSYAPPAALAQGTGLSGNYMVVAGEVQNDKDALYLLDLRARILYPFYFDTSNKRLTPGNGYRDLGRDFRHNEKD